MAERQRIYLYKGVREGRRGHSAVGLRRESNWADQSIYGTCLDAYLSNKPALV